MKKDTPEQAEFREHCRRWLAENKPGPPPTRLPEYAIEIMTEDLRRYREGEPTRVRPAGLLGRLWNWVLRNPLPTSLLVTVTVLLAFGLFSATYYARLRFLYSGTLIGATGALLAYALLQWTPPRRGLVVLSGMVGLTLAEATWALNYWAASFLLGGALLLVIFYVGIGLVQNHLEGTLSKRIFWEYGLLGGGLLAAVVLATFR